MGGAVIGAVVVEFVDVEFVGVERLASASFPGGCERRWLSTAERAMQPITTTPSAANTIQRRRSPTGGGALIAELRACGGSGSFGRARQPLMWVAYLALVSSSVSSATWEVPDFWRSTQSVASPGVGARPSR